MLLHFMFCSVQSIMEITHNEKNIIVNWFSRISYVKHKKTSLLHDKSIREREFTGMNIGKNVYELFPIQTSSIGMFRLIPSQYGHLLDISGGKVCTKH